MRFGLACETPVSPPAFLTRLAAAITARGHRCVGPDASRLVAPRLLLHATDVHDPRSHYVREDPATYVATVLESPRGDVWRDRESLRRASYGALVRTLSNVVVHVVGPGGPLGNAAWIVTPELGMVPYRETSGLGARVAGHLLPLAAARLLIGNRLEYDLPPDACKPDAAARSLMTFGHRLARQNLLPSVFSLDEFLDDEARRTLRLVFGIRQLSYGNMSVRRDGGGFWMSARGVDKGALHAVGHDVLLVKGLDRDRGEIVLSVPQDGDRDARVSVDAIEHFRIYEALPEVGAIVHVHAWMDGVEATSQSWPCGSEELADEVLEIVLGQPDPAHAVVGLRNHGLTITGSSLEEIGERIEGRLRQGIPVMEAS